MTTHILRYLILVFLFLIFSPSKLLKAQANPLPEQDCFNAIPICATVFTQNRSYAGQGLFPTEIDPDISCLRTGEQNSVWFQVSILDPGMLSFLITPNFALDDYDFAVYNLTNSNCAEIATDSSLEVSCNYAAQSGPTGADTPGAPSSQGALGRERNAPIPVLAGEIYVINVSNFSGTAAGFTLDLRSSTTTIGSAFPSLSSGIRRIGTTDTFSLRLSSPLRCSSIEASDFQILGNASPLDSIWSPNCVGNSQDFRFIPATPFPPNMLPSLVIVDTVYDACGNFSLSDTLRPDPFTGFELFVDERNVCQGESTTLSTNLPDSGFTFLWMPGQETTSSITVAPEETTTYSVQVNEIGSTRSVSSSTVIVVDPLPEVDLGPDYSFCDSSTTLSISPSSYVFFTWEDNTTDSTRIITQSGTYSVFVNGQNGCDNRDTIVISQEIPAEALFSWQTDTLSVNFTDNSTQADSIFWNFGDGSFSTDPNPTHTYNRVGTYTVSQIVSNACSRDTLSQEVVVTGWATSIAEEILAQYLQIAPNPGDRFIQLHFLHDSFRGKELRLYDLQGRLLRDYGRIQQEILQIERNDLPTGIYLLRVGFLARKIQFE